METVRGWLRFGLTFPRENGLLSLVFEPEEDGVWNLAMRRSFTIYQSCWALSEFSDAERTASYLAHWTLFKEIVGLILNCSDYWRLYLLCYWQVAFVKATDFGFSAVFFSKKGMEKDWVRKFGRGNQPTLDAMIRQKGRDLHLMWHFIETNDD